MPAISNVPSCPHGLVLKFINWIIIVLKAMYYCILYPKQTKNIKNSADHSNFSKNTLRQDLSPALFP